MKTTVLNGSPRKQNTTALTHEFADEARQAGHVVDILPDLRSHPDF